MIKKWIREIFCPRSVIVSDIFKTLKLPSKGMLSHISKIYLGMSEDNLRKILKEHILREHKNPFEGEDLPIKNCIDTIISVNAWPEIYRYVINEKRVISAIIEIGIHHKRFDKIFSKVEEKIQIQFSNSFEAIIEDNMKYAIYKWEYAGYCCYLHVVNEKLVNINPLFYDYDYFGDEFDGTFVRKAKSRYQVLPTIVVIYSKDWKAGSLSWLYLQKDLAKRSETVSLLNIPTFLEKI